MAANKGIDWDSQPLGEVSDGELARRLGVHPTSVYNARTKRRLPVAGNGLASLPKGIDWGAQPLGDVPDSELARRLGVTQSTVQYARTTRGIPRATETVRCACGETVERPVTGGVSSRWCCQQCERAARQARQSRQPVDLYVATAALRREIKAQQAT